MKNALPIARKNGHDDVLNPDRLREHLTREVDRLDRLLEKYYTLAMNGDGSCINAGLLYCKLASRKSILLGLNAPTSSAMQIIIDKRETKTITTTQDISDLIDSIRGKPLPKPAD